MVVIDYRSDTVTKPSAAMLQAMMNANVGDDVYGEDETVNELEAITADMFGMEAAVFCASGTMTNQIAIKAHTQPGDDVICDINAHVYQYEGGGIAFNSGASVKLLEGERGRVTARQVVKAIQPEDNHRPHTSLVCIENTSNRGGGSCYDFKELENIGNVCTNHQIAYHLDGARLFNALVAKRETPLQYGNLFDSISICLSKGLGAPVGSLLLGNKNFIKKARRIRKVFGGGMRQAGFLAAAGLYAIQNNIERLQIDHGHAMEISKTLATKSFVKNILPVETNIIILETVGETATAWVDQLKQKNILAHAMASDRIRFVTHLDITPPFVDITIEAIKSL